MSSVSIKSVLQGECVSVSVVVASISTRRWSCERSGISLHVCFHAVVLPAAVAILPADLYNAQLQRYVDVLVTIASYSQHLIAACALLQVC
jgi:hypothetical protein